MSQNDQSTGSVDVLGVEVLDAVKDRVQCNMLHIPMFSMHCLYCENNGVYFIKHWGSYK